MIILSRLCKYLLNVFLAIHQIKLIPNEAYHANLIGNIILNINTHDPWINRFFTFTSGNLKRSKYFFDNRQVNFVHLLWHTHTFGANKIWWSKSFTVGITHISNRMLMNLFMHISLPKNKKHWQTCYSLIFLHHNHRIKLWSAMFD